MKEQKKGLIFDVDGTLIKTDIAFVEETMKKTMAETGDGTYNREMAAYFWWGGNGFDREEILKQEFGVEDTERFWKIWTSYVEDFDYAKQFKSAYEDVAESVRLLNLRNVSLGIVTDPPRILAGPQIEMFLPKGYFTPIVTLSDTPGLKSKPDPKGLLFCMNQMGLSPREVAYVGDATNDLIAARNAGMDFFRINRGEHNIYLQPEREINSLYELLE